MRYMHSGMKKVPFAGGLVLLVSAILFTGPFMLIPTSAEAAYGYGGYGTYGSGSDVNSLSVGAGSDACVVPVTSSFTPYIYNGHLDSFEYTVTNQSSVAYLPLTITVAGEDVDLSYVSVWRKNGSDTVLVHVDVPESIALGKDVEITVSNLQVTQGPPPICFSGAVFHVKLADVYTSSAPIQSTGSPSVTIETSTTTVATSTKPAISISDIINQQQPATTTAADTENQCRTISPWWLAILAVINVLVSAALLIMMSFIARSNLRLALAVLVPPAVFVGLWYIVNTCHSNTWFPILSIALAIIVLTGSGTPNAFEKVRIHMMQFFGKRTKNVQMKLAEATSIMEVTRGK